MPTEKGKRMRCKVKVIKELLELFPECRPEVGKVYDADFVLGSGKAKDVAVIDVADKKIVLRLGEFAFVED